MPQSDENKKEGIFLTQEDIDQALRPDPASDDIAGDDDGAILTLDESDIVESGTAVEEEPEDLEAFGLLSKDDIEALLHGDLLGSSQQEAQDEIDSLLDAERSGSVSGDADTGAVTEKKIAAQDEVEQLMQSAARDARDGVDEGATSMPEAGETGSGTGDTVSQDDIERLLADAADGAGNDSEAVSEVEETASGTGDTISQDDIERLLATTEDDAADEVAVTPEADTAEGEEGGVSQDDIDKLLMTAVDDMEDESEQPREAVSEGPEEGVAISQDDIDRLLKGADADMGDEPDAAPVADATGPEETPDASGGSDSLISQTDLDQLMGETLSEAATETSTAPDTEDTADHITQDDINKLLKESIDEEGEAAALEDEAGAPDAPVAEDTQDPVILAEDESSSDGETAAPEKSSARKKKTGRRKLPVKSRYIAGAAAGIVLLVSVSLMMFTSDQVETVPQPRALTFSVSAPEDVVSETPAFSGKSLQLPGFVVLAPSNSSAVTYLSADVLLAFSDSDMVSVIKENEAFVRDIIYGTINQALMTRDISDINEVSLEMAIRKALAGIIPREAIERVDFERFSMA